MTNFEIVYKPPNRRRLTSGGIGNEDTIDDNELDDERDAHDCSDEIDVEHDEEEDDNESDSSSDRVEDSSRPYRLTGQISRRHGIFLQVRLCRDHHRLADKHSVVESGRSVVSREAGS